MDNKTAIKILKIEKACVERNTGTKNCNRQCESCDLLLPDHMILDAYDTAISALSHSHKLRKESSDTTKRNARRKTDR